MRLTGVQVMRFVFLVIGATLIALEYGARIGWAVGLLLWVSLAKAK
jgi:hypothetical protein